MIAGHFGFAALVKSREKQVPLWALMLGTQWLDVVFAPLFAAGVEHLEPVPGTHGGYGEVIIHADYTHSLVGALALSLVFGGLGVWRWGGRSGVALGVVSFSHWVLDLVVHRHDMPILPGNVGALPRLGLGLWSTPAIAIAIEVALVLAGTFTYWRAATGVARRATQPEVMLRRAHVAAATMLATGALTMTLNALGQ